MIWIPSLDIILPLYFFSDSKLANPDVNETPFAGQTSFLNKHWEERKKKNEKKFKEENIHSQAIRYNTCTFGKHS